MNLPKSAVFGADARDAKVVEPQHQHDCKHCAFLGSLGSADTYVCTKNDDGLGASYIVRYSSEPSDYYSTCDFNNKHLNYLMGSISGGSALYYRRVALLHLCSTGVTNLMKGGKI